MEVVFPCCFLVTILLMMNWSTPSPMGVVWIMKGTSLFIFVFLRIKKLAVNTHLIPIVPYLAYLAELIAMKHLLHALLRLKQLHSECDHSLH
jgi:hypothetical protein